MDIRLPAQHAEELMQELLEEGAVLTTQLARLKKEVDGWTGPPAHNPKQNIVLSRTLS